MKNARLVVDRNLIVEVAKDVCPNATEQLLDLAVRFIGGEGEVILQADPAPRPLGRTGVSDLPDLTNASAIGRIAAAYFERCKKL